MRKKHFSCVGFNKKLRKEIKENMISYKQKVKSIKNINQFKKKVFENQEKRKKSKSRHKDKIRSCKNNNELLKDFLKKELTINTKKSKKFMSQIELKMIGDKNLQKLKPIKKSNFSLNNNPIKNNNNDNNNSSYSFIRSDSSKTDSTVIHLVSEINKV